MYSSYCKCIMYKKAINFIDVAVLINLNVTNENLILWEKIDA